MSEPMEPRLESVRGYVHPYRGMENHGVEPTSPEMEPVERWDVRGEVVKYETPEPEQAPIPVKIVQQGAKEVPQWAGATYTLVDANRPVLIAGRLEHRTSLAISNDGDNPAFLHPDGNVTTSNFAAVRLMPGGSFSLDNGAEVWAFVEAGPTTLRVVWEYTVEA